MPLLGQATSKITSVVRKDKRKGTTSLMQKIMSLRVIYFKEKHVDMSTCTMTVHYRQTLKLLKDHHAIRTFIPSNK